MTGLYLDLNDRTAVIDFIVEAAEYLPAGHEARVRAEKIVQDIEDRKSVSREALADAAKELARAAWAPRVALRRYLRTTEGQHDEWRRVVAAVSNSTAHLLERFRAGTRRDAIGEVLEHEESSSAFHEKERFEIAEVIRHVHPAMWHEKRNDLAAHQREAEAELLKIEKKIDELRELGFSTEAVPDEEIIAKIARLHDRLYFEAEELNVGRLEEEIALYREQKEIPIGG
jgi:hypothetical protein